MPTPGSYRSVINHLRNTGQDIQEYFDPAEELILNYDYRVTLSYMFSVIETIQNRCLQCGLIKKHKVNKEIAQIAVDNEHITRPRFRELFLTIFGKNLSQKAKEKIQQAEEIRDKVLHGKSVREADLRKAIVDIIEYAELLDEEVHRAARFHPFGDLRGFIGRTQTLPKDTSRWVVKGIGFKEL